MARMSSKRRSLLIIAVAAVLAVTAASPFLHGLWRDYRLRDLAAQCHTAQNDGQWTRLSQAAALWTAWDPTAGEAWMYRAQAARAQQEWSLAADSLWSVPDSAPEAVPALIELSKLSFSELNEPLRGVAACERILSIDHRAAGAQEQLIWFYAMTLQRQKLLRQIRAAVAAESEPREAYVYYFLAYTLRSATAVKLNERWLERAPDEELFLVARVLQFPEPTTQETEAEGPSAGVQPPAGGGRSKLDEVNKLFQRFPQNLELLAYKIDERIEAADVAAVGRLLGQAPVAARDDNRFWRFKGWLHESNNEFDEAAEAYQQALGMHIMDWNTMNRLAVVERRRQHPAEVARLTRLTEQANEIRRGLKKLTAVELVTPPLLLQLAKLYQECGEKDVGPALQRRMRQFSGQRP